MSIIITNLNIIIKFVTRFMVLVNNDHLCNVDDSIDTLVLKRAFVFIDIKVGR